MLSLSKLPVSTSKGFGLTLRLLSTQSPLSPYGGVHGASNTRAAWRSKPLLKREGAKIFKTGFEAAQLLTGEAMRKDSDCKEFIDSWSSMTHSLTAVFERLPKYAWVMKQLTEPERTLSFRVAWIDDGGVSRVNRGYRVQYCSALGPFEGGLAFSERTDLSLMKANAFDTTFSNALSGALIGGAYGGADFNPYTKSDAEIQRFCQSYMTELSKYIGPDVDLPSLGDGATGTEIGYLYGQYKRLTHHHGRPGHGLLWGGDPSAYIDAQGFGAVYFAQEMLCDKGDSLKGKRCLITGSHYVALAVAQKLYDLGAIPITLSDTSGYIYEPGGFNQSKIDSVKKIKSERGARVGRYIIASTSAQFDEPDKIYDIPCDLVFSCSHYKQIDEEIVNKLVSTASDEKNAVNTFKGVIECVSRTVSADGSNALKKRGLLHGPYRATTAGAGMINGLIVQEKRNAIDTPKKLDAFIEGNMKQMVLHITFLDFSLNTIQKLFPILFIYFELHLLLI